jgi:hypothetical protein
MSLATTFKLIENDLLTWADEAEDLVEGLGIKLWGAFKVIALALEPALIKEFTGLVSALQAAEGTALADLADFETALLNKASPLLREALGALESQAIQALIVIVSRL